MAEPTREPHPLDPPTGDARPSRRTPNLLMVLVGLASLATAAVAIVGYLPAIPAFDPRWLLAVGAVVVGLGLLAGTLRR